MAPLLFSKKLLDLAFIILVLHPLLIIKTGALLAFHEFSRFAVVRVFVWIDEDPILLFIHHLLVFFGNDGGSGCRRWADEPPSQIRVALLCPALVGAGRLDIAIRLG